MARYSTGIATKKKIIDVCKDLFYNKGYRETTFKGICETAGVNPGSISYHFSDKKNIAAHIYKETMGTYMRQIPELFPEEDELTQLILQLGAHLRVFYADAAYRRFSIQFPSDYFYISNMSEYKTHFANIYSFLTKSMDLHKADFYIAAYATMDTGIETYIDLNIDKLTYEQAVMYSNELYLSFISNDERTRKIKRALELLNTLNIENNVFDIAIAFKK